MAFTQDTNDYDIVAALADRPNAVTGLTAAQLKAKFDEGNNTSQTFFNGTHIAELESTTDGSSGADNVGATAVGTGSATTVQGVMEEIDTKVTTNTSNIATNTSNIAANTADIAALAPLSGKVNFSTADVTNPPTSGEIVGIWGDPSTVGGGFIGFINDAGGDVASYIAVSDGVRYWTVSMTKATD